MAEKKVRTKPPKSSGEEAARSRAAARAQEAADNPLGSEQFEAILDAMRAGKKTLVSVAESLGLPESRLRRRCNAFSKEEIELLRKKGLKGL